VRRQPLGRAAGPAVALTSAALLLGAGCDRVAQVRQRWEASAYLGADSMGTVPRDTVTIPLRAPRELVENSAAAMSARQPGVWFTINDSGNEPKLFALDTTGADRGVWRVLNATNVDWESAAVGPCATGAPTESCVYIGDTGDNQARLPFRVIYRTREPEADGRRDTLRADALRYTYSDGPHDVEAMYVAPNGDIILITKRPLIGRDRRLRPALVFALAAPDWTSAGTSRTVEARLIDSLPIVPGSTALRTITDGALSPDARHLAVRTYAQVYIFATDTATGRVNHAVPPRVCNIAELGEELGEGVTWADARGRLVLTSEGATAPMHLATCQLP